jgi:hypothetical protein
MNYTIQSVDLQLKKKRLTNNIAIYKYGTRFVYI